ncbi:MAG: Crp/Fnr family transcriptional regulator [Candidatus Acidiferrum sp.]
MKKNPARISQSATKGTSVSSYDLFKELPASALSDLARHSTVQDAPSGHVFFQLGETGKMLFLLEKGRVETFRTSGKKKLIIAELTPPGVFGEMGCVGACTYHCSARATEPSCVRTITKSTIDALQKKYPVVTRRLLDLISRRFVHVLLDLDATSFRTLIPRLARLLLDRAEGDRVLNMSHKEIATHLRVYRESATAALGELRKAGIIAVERMQIRILERSRLERAARES